VARFSCLHVHFELGSLDGHRSASNVSQSRTAEVEPSTSFTSMSSSDHDAASSSCIATATPLVRNPFDSFLNAADPEDVDPFATFHFFGGPSFFARQSRKPFLNGDDPFAHSLSGQSSPDSKNNRPRSSGSGGIVRASGRWSRNRSRKTPSSSSIAKPRSVSVPRRDTVREERERLQEHFKALSQRLKQYKQRVAELEGAMMIGQHNESFTSLATSDSNEDSVRRRNSYNDIGGELRRLRTESRRLRAEEGVENLEVGGRVLQVHSVSLLEGESRELFELRQRLQAVEEENRSLQSQAQKPQLGQSPHPDSSRPVLSPGESNNLVMLQRRQLELSQSFLNEQKAQSQRLTQNQQEVNLHIQQQAMLIQELRKQLDGVRSTQYTTAELHAADRAGLELKVSALIHERESYRMESERFKRALDELKHLHERVIMERDLAKREVNELSSRIETLETSRATLLLGDGGSPRSSRGWWGSLWRKLFRSNSSGGGGGDPPPDRPFLHDKRLLSSISRSSSRTPETTLH